jgi:excisionase family DNA binding protein
VDHRIPLTLSPAEAAVLLGVSRWAIYDAVKRGDLAAVRVGQRIRVAALPLYAELGVPEETPTAH